MIFVTGDTHGIFTRLNTKNFPIQKKMSKEDYVIILGDFGGIWNSQPDKNESYWMDWLESKSFTTLFIDGNHENFDRLDQLRIENWMGGNVHIIRPSILHLMRGQLFTIENQVIFTFGGARSHDISDGILEKNDIRLKNSRWMRKHRYNIRINHLEWWQQEMPSSAEMEEGLNNLNKVNLKVDVILTHCAPTSIQSSINHGNYMQDALTDYLEKIHNNVKYKSWYFGHYHDDLDINDKDRMLYNRIVRIL